jgi:hypothetical protein
MQAPFSLQHNSNNSRSTNKIANHTYIAIYCSFYNAFPFLSAEVGKSQQAKKTDASPRIKGE